MPETEFTMKSIWIAVIFAMVSLADAQAAERWVGQQKARVSIGADGRISAISLPGSTLSASMQGAIADRVRKVEFEPATVNGAPATAETTLLIQLEAKVQHDQLALDIYGIDVIAGYRKTTPPRYPARELRKGITGEAWVRVEYDRDGRVTGVAPAAADAPVDVFMSAAIAAARNWEMEPELVDGKGVPGTATVPVRFSIEGKDSPGAPSGDLKFPDGGVLRVYQTEETPWTLAQSRVRVRSPEAAMGMIDGGS